MITACVAHGLGAHFDLPGNLLIERAERRHGDHLEKREVLQPERARVAAVAETGAQHFNLRAFGIAGTGIEKIMQPATFASWASEAPDDFVFSIKGPRYATNRRVLAEAGELDQAIS